MGIYAYSLSTTIANLLASFRANWRIPPRLTAFICDLSMPLLMNCLAMYRARAMLSTRFRLAVPVASSAAPVMWMVR